MIPYDMSVSRSGVAEFLRTAIHLLNFVLLLYYKDFHSEQAHDASHRTMGATSCSKVGGRVVMVTRQ